MPFRCGAMRPHAPFVFIRRRCSGSGCSGSGCSGCCYLENTFHGRPVGRALVFISALFCGPFHREHLPFPCWKPALWCAACFGYEVEMVGWASFARKCHHIAHLQADSREVACASNNTSRCRRHFPIKPIATLLDFDLPANRRFGCSGWHRSGACSSGCSG